MTEPVRSPKSCQVFIILEMSPRKRGFRAIQNIYVTSNNGTMASPVFI
jgi:hypothetical protein